MAGDTLASPERVAEFELEELGSRPPRQTILLAEPDDYTVTREDNPHTTDEHGQLHEVDPAEARRQWDQLRGVYASLGFDVEIVPAEPGLPDLVFCRNSVFPYLDPETGERRFVPGRMRYEGRRGEVPVVARHLEALGYEATPLPSGVTPFECGGDLVRLGQSDIVFAGTGERTARKSLEAAAELLASTLVVLELADPEFYHLDTCLAALDEETIAWVPAAFTTRSRRIVQALPIETIAVPEDEARATLAANLHCPDGEHVLIDEANQATIEQLADRGYDVRAVDTSEFGKAGGSVFCLTNQLW